jgi:hypothetical protein
LIQGTDHKFETVYHHSTTDVTYVKKPSLRQPNITDEEEMPVLHTILLRHSNRESKIQGAMQKPQKMSAKSKTGIQQFYLI